MQAHYRRLQVLTSCSFDFVFSIQGPTSPALYIFDCSNAGVIVDAFQHFMQQRQEKEKEQPQTQQDQQPSNSTIHNSTPRTNFSPAILLAACAATELLPITPELPADLFTSCLTTPIKTALLWFSTRSLLTTPSNITAQMIDHLPGTKKMANRKLPYGEMNWIFTAITDSIAWNVLPTELFQKLFRQDLLVASLFRNYLLAQRIFHSLNCTTVSVPALPTTHLHPMWQAWDLAVDLCLTQLEKYERDGIPFQPSTFFQDQLTSFEVYLEFAHLTPHTTPMQLPVVLQVLLSTEHRIRALELLARFVDLGQWAIHLALSVGIHPYILKLLQSPSNQLSPLLIFLWAKIIAHDNTVQQEVGKKEYFKYILDSLKKIQHERKQERLAEQQARERNINPINTPNLSSNSSTPYFSSTVHDRIDLTSFTLSSNREEKGETIASRPTIAMFPNLISPTHALSSNPSPSLNPSTSYANLADLNTPILSPALLPSASTSPILTATAGQQAVFHSLSSHLSLQILHSQKLQILCSLFLLTAIINEQPKNQELLFSQEHVLEDVVAWLDEEDDDIQEWVCLLLGKLWDNFSQAKTAALNLNIPSSLLPLLFSSSSSVRCSALFALGNWFGGRTLDETTGQLIRENQREATEIKLATSMIMCVYDGSSTVRHTLLHSLTHLFNHHLSLFLTLSSVTNRRSSPSRKAWSVWVCLKKLCSDPVTIIREQAREVKDKIKRQAVAQGQVQGLMGGKITVCKKIC